MSESERFDRGWKLLTEVDGDAAERVMKVVGEQAPDLARYIVEFAYGDVWSRRGLDRKERELATCSALIALGHCQPELKVHLNGMLRTGWTREQILELIIHMSVYVGFPGSLDALRVAQELFSELDAGEQDVPST